MKENSQKEYKTEVAASTLTYSEKQIGYAAEATLSSNARMASPSMALPTSQTRVSRSAMAQEASGKTGLIAAYMARHAEDKKMRIDYCYRHHPDHRNLMPDKNTMDQLQEDLNTLPEEDCEAISHIWSLFGAADARQRQIILRGMLSRCCFPQLSDVAAMVKDLVRIDFVSSLPIELSFKILCYLDAKSLTKASMVNKQWKSLADDDVVWYHLCEQHIDRKCTTCGWGLPLLDRRRLRRSKRAITQRLETLSTQHRHVSPFSGPRSVIPSGTVECVDDNGSINSQVLGKRHADELADESHKTKRCRTRPWKDVYIERYKIENNWRAGKHTSKDFQHPSPVLCLQFDEQYLITGTYDGQIFVWDVETGELIRVMREHFRAVSALKFDGVKLVTGSWDQSVRVWDYRSGQCLCTCAGHDSKVLAIDLDRDLIVAGSADATVKIWDFAAKSCYTLRGHTGPVHSVRLHCDSKTVYTSSEDMTVRMWCLVERKCIRVFGGPENGPLAHVAQIQQALPITLEHLEGEEEHYSLLAHQAPSDNYTTTTGGEDHRAANENSAVDPHAPTHLLTASLDNTIKLWDIRTGRCVRTLFGHVEGVWCIAANNFRIVSGAYDKLVKVWDLQSGRCWHTFSGHTKPVCCVGLNDTGFASGGDDGLVRVYSFDI